MIISPRLWAVLAGGVVLISPLRADDDDETAAATTAARQWIAEIDAGNYDRSYNDGSSALHEKVHPDTWVRILKTERPVLGKLVSREQTGVTYKPSGFEGADGEFMIVSYRSAFENKPHEIEYVVLRREGGRWLGTGYDFGPEEVTNDPNAGPSTTTTSETETPPVPGATATNAPPQKQGAP
jgi:hypothetical protein